jgi:hypothetical protein
MKRTNYVVLSGVMLTALAVYGVSMLRDLREIGPITPDSQVAMSSSHADCGWFCQVIVAIGMQAGADFAWGVVKNNSCNSGCAGGGGGGFPQGNGGAGGQWDSGGGNECLADRCVQ